MVEGRSCLVSRRFSRSCQAGTSWDCMSCQIEFDVKGSKRPLEPDAPEEHQQRKSSKISEKCQDERADGSCELSNGNVEHKEASFLENGSEGGAFRGQRRKDNDPEEADQSDSRRQAGGSSDSDSLIHTIGRDNSISCLIRCSRSDYGSIASLNQSFRSLIRSGLLYRLRRQNNVVEHWIYFSCDSLEWVAFDPIRHRWMQLPRMITNECFIVSDKESLAVGTELLVFTKFIIFRYSILTNSWSPGTRMKTPRCLFGSASLGEIAIVAGGSDEQLNILSSAELYNSETQEWEELPSMLKPRKMCSAVFMDGKFYVIGGIGGSDSKVLTCGEEYDLKTRTWTEIPDMAPLRAGGTRGVQMPAAAEAPPLIASVNNELYAADHNNMEVMKFDKVRRVWFTVGRLPERAASMHGWGLAFRACGDSLIVIGGPRAAGASFLELNSWVPSEGPPEWNLLDTRRSSSFVHNCAVMGC
ncbi:F-box/kelch-repeat protein SKIP11-like isoform X2 [Punica granatum]|uniref:F-box/kelch-repeat protein SKIP11-like isoform X2 n=1 Tax=Punica granatum TaxID=22663 RepID=A0A6P8E5H7_PUNGR|nr:F-box/kelch-repeat protein SKIP11-like isoform X2 [Punica granatum]